MPVVVPVKFAYAARELWFDPCRLDIVEGDHAICQTERGVEIGLVTSDPFSVSKDELAAPLKPVVRIATDTDLDRADDLADMGEDAMFDFRRLIEKNDLDMKPVGVEYLFGGEKAVFYFAAEDRVDFRQLVKDLSAHFHVRVDMRQIGVRDETRLQGGYATCGQELCCTRFGGTFEPISIRMAKEQDLPLNSSKISGVCGRLMCCLRYEFEAYKDFKSRAPKKKTLIDTPLGKARIMEYNTPREQLVLRLESGKVFRVNLADMSCSAENKKRCEQQGCNCRPDCVSRSVMDRLDSPDLQLALMELDRQNGVDVGDGLDTADRIVASGPTPRRRRMREEEAEKFENPAPSRGKARPKSVQEPSASGSGAGARKRRRPAQNDEIAQGRQEAASSEGSSRRRRRHVSPDAPKQQPERTNEETNPSRSRRRKHVAAGDAPGAQREGGQARRSHKPSMPSVADQVSGGNVKVARRKPGDGGGPVAQGNQPARPELDGAPKKRRRRRSRKPRQDGNAGGSGQDGASKSE